MPFLDQFHFVLLLMQPKKGTRAMAFLENLEQVSSSEVAAIGPKKLRFILCEGSRKLLTRAEKSMVTHKSPKCGGNEG